MQLLYFYLLFRQYLCHGWPSLGMEQHHLCEEALEVLNLDRLDSCSLDDLPLASCKVSAVKDCYILVSWKADLLD